MIFELVYTFIPSDKPSETPATTAVVTGESQTATPISDGKGGFRPTISSATAAVLASAANEVIAEQGREKRKLRVTVPLVLATLETSPVVRIFLTSSCN